MRISNFVAKATEPLFPRIEKELMGEANEPKVEAKAEPKEEKNEEGIISIDDFAKIVIKVGEVLECERVEGSEKLLKFKIDLGEEQPRQYIWYRQILRA